MPPRPGKLPGALPPAWRPSPQIRTCSSVVSSLCSACISAASSCTSCPLLCVTLRSLMLRPVALGAPLAVRVGRPPPRLSAAELLVVPL